MYGLYPHTHTHLQDMGKNLESCDFNFEHTRTHTDKRVSEYELLIKSSHTKVNGELILLALFILRRGQARARQGTLIAACSYNCPPAWVCF